MKLKALIFFILFVATTKAQVVVWEPAFPTDTDSLVVIFDATLGSAGLATAGPPIYAHTGVITNLSTSPSDWKYVKAAWNQNIPACQMTFLGNAKWKIAFKIREFYNVPLTEQILKVAFVFRNSAGTLTGKNADGSDIFVPVYEAGLNIRIVKPYSFPILVNLNTQIPVLVVTKDAVNTKLYIDNSLKTETTNDTLQYSISVTEYGTKLCKVVAEDISGNTKVDSFYYTAKQPVVIEPLPTGIKPGINYIDDHTVTLALFAPAKEYVYVIGDFNDWQINADYYMKQTPDDSTFWITINNLTPGVEYGFQYLVNAILRLPDPYTEKVLDPWNDQYIDEITYPNLKNYPSGKTSEIVSVLQTGQQVFNWTAVNYTKPDEKNLIIYELLLRDFLNTHNYKTLTDTLDYLQNLGINAIELMPFNEFEGNNSWGYNPSFYFAPDKYYGPANDLKVFIDECHKRNIAVVMDMVLNHSFGQSPFVRLYASGTYGPPTAQNLWYNINATHPYSVGYDFNHESVYTKQLVDRVLKYWIDEYKIDGYRFDLSKGFTQKNSGTNVGLWGNYDQTRIDLWKRIGNKVWSYAPSTYMILEHFADNSEETVLANYGFMLWGNMNYAYNEATMGFTGNLNNASYKNRGWNEPRLVTYMESHDEERLMYKNLNFGGSSGTYNVKTLSTALSRMQAANALFLTIPGPKMIWQFGELGYDVSITYPCMTSDCRTDPKPIIWGYNTVLNRTKLYKAVSALNKLKTTYEVFKTTDFIFDAANKTKRINLNHSSMYVTVIGNFDMVSLDINPQFQSTGKWYDYFSGDSITVSNTSQLISLLPGEFHVYSTVRMGYPGDDVLVNVEDNYNNNCTIIDFELEQNYPNPFNPETQIKYNLPNADFISLKIYDILGNEIKTLVNGYQYSGSYTLTWSGDNNSGTKVSSGVYFYSLQTNNKNITRKMMLVK
ncbi:MAG: alpha-amylase family glycosyl hydrolase [bacterium]